MSLTLRTHVAVPRYDPEGEAFNHGGVERDSSTVWANAAIPGRPRWAVLDQSRDRYLVNIREPTVVVALDARTGAVTATWAIASKGPHGIDIDDQGGRIFVSCDGGTVSVL